MPGPILPSILEPFPLNRVISQLNVVNNRLQTFFGAGIGSQYPGTEGNPNATPSDHVEQMSGRNYRWDIFNNTREVATARHPGTPAATIARQAVGQQVGVFPRSAEKIPLLYEEVHNYRTIGASSAQMDAQGEAYIRRQARYLAQRFVNLREFQLAGMLRGKYYFGLTTGISDEIQHSLSSTNAMVTVDFRVPAANITSTVTGFISATWGTTSTDIPSDVYAINTDCEQQTGLPIAHAFCSPTTFMAVQKNAVLQAISGSANIVFEQFTRNAHNDFTCVMRGLPWLTWHIVPGGININGTYTKLIEDKYVAFCPEPTPDWITYLEGSEPIVEAEGRAPVERFGAHFWAKPTDDPASILLHGVHNGIPALLVPGAVYYQRVIT